MVPTVWENIGPWIQESEKIFLLKGHGKDKGRKRKGQLRCSFLVPTVWENIDLWIQQSEKILIWNGYGKDIEMIRSGKRNDKENVRSWFQQSKKVLILGFNSLRKY